MAKVADEAVAHISEKKAYEILQIIQHISSHISLSDLWGGIRLDTISNLDAQMAKKIRHVIFFGKAGEAPGIPLPAWDRLRGIYITRTDSAALCLGCRAIEIADFLHQCSEKLEILEVTGTDLAVLDTRNLPGITHLYLRDNHALDSVRGVSHQQNLTEFEISGSAKLTKLLLSGCIRLRSLIGFDDLSSLDYLDLSKCSSLTALMGLEKLTQLTDLRLSGCRNLATLPCLDSLTRLRNLDVSDCRNLMTLPEMDHLFEMVHLDCHGCRNLTKLPRMDKLTQLIYLNLSGCGSLSELPSLEKLTKLVTLNLSECSTLITPPSLDKLSQLTELDLSGCRSLITLPRLDNLTRLTSATRLDLSNCSSLIALPSLDKLKQLRHLTLSNCSSLTKLPELNELTHLISLNLSGCSSLRALPSMEKLTHLVSMNLSGCSNLTRLPKLEMLPQLKELCFSGCSSLTTVSDLDMLPQLNALDLSGCSSLKKLPEGIRYASSLRLLNLQGLRLQVLPLWLYEITESFSLSRFAWNAGKQKACVYLHGTNIEGVDMSIFEQPYEMVVEWFKSRNRVPLNEIKVVFLGDGEAGKSHTIARLMNDGGEPDKEIFDGQSTPGIVIRNKEYDLDDRKIQVHYWDFGGQEIMHSMHRIFLTGRTMYVILLNARDDTQSDRAKYWLHNVKSFAPNAPVLLVLNKIDQNPNASVDEKDLRGRYNKLTQVVRLSALKDDQEKFNKRLTKILLDEIQKTGFLDAQWPVSWTKVKGKLESLDIKKSPYIKGDAYQEICGACQVEDNQKNLLHWFNDLGISFCCCDEDDYALEDYVILRPDWITNALYIILFNKCEGAKNGLIPHKSIHTLLKNAHNNPEIRCTLPKAKYSSDNIQYVLGVMRKFQLSLDAGDNREFIPMLCQQNSTVDIQCYHQDADTLEFNMEFDYLPNNLLHRLMVERHGELDMENVWRTGARFQLPELKLSAVVVIDGNTLRFFVRHGDDMHRPNTYLAILKANVDRIVKKMGLKAPVSQLIYKVHGKRAEFGYDRLLKLRARGRREEYCEALDEDFLIEDILNQSAPDGTAEELQLLEDIVRSCQNIQAGMEYASSGDGTGLEDIRNRRIQNDLSGKYRIFDQPQRGFGGTGQSSGELDLYLEDQSGKPWTIIEALRVCNGDKSDWKKHLNKLLGGYNFFGLGCAYLLTYVDADETKFANIWAEYPQCIKGYSPGKYSFLDGSYMDLSSSNEQYIRKVKCCYTCGDIRVTVYHLFVMVKPKPPKPVSKPKKKSQ